MIVATITLILAILFALFSSAVISYVAMATPIGPWMEMTLVLLGTVIVRALFHRISVVAQIGMIANATVAGGIAGAVAIACAFSFPTLYFLDPALFNSFMRHPGYFCSFLAALVIAAGSFGLFLASLFEERMLSDPAMVFPIGQMVYNMIAVQVQVKKAAQLMVGAAVAFVYGILQKTTILIPVSLTFFPTLQYGIFAIPSLVVRNTDIIPMFWAIGFTTGHVIAVPLLVAVIAKIVLVDPVQTLFFSTLSQSDYLLAFGSGMVIQGALFGLADIPAMIAGILKRWHVIKNTPLLIDMDKKILSWLTIIAISVAFLAYCSMGIVAQSYLLFFTLICTYQLLIIAGKLGIAPIGRFATFVMIPGLLLFGYDAVQVTVVASFVEIAGIVAVDALFGRKMGQLTHHMPRASIVFYQWIGLLVTAGVIGILFWMLITQFGLGSAELSASRAQSRAVLVQAYHFDYMVMIFGFIFGYCLKFIRVNSTLVFGGLLMGLDIALMLIAGGLSTYLVRDKEEYYPFFSGVYAANSLWIFIKMLF